MGSTGRAQAALFAAIAMVLLTGYYLVDDFALIGDATALFLLGSVVPSIVWAAFFFVVYRNSPSARTVTWMTLLLAVLLEGVVDYIRFQESVSYWTPLGNALSLYGWLLRLGWAVFLIAFGLAPDRKRTRQIALLLAIVSIPLAWSTAFDAWNSGIGFLIGDIPRETFWRVLITPAIRTIYWLSQVLFLWTIWGNPEPAGSIEATSARLAP